jgi:rhodanese-related sulfurtransferase
MFIVMIMLGVVIDDSPVFADTCGVSAVFGAAVSFGKKPAFEQLLDEKFISSRNGSTLIDLTEAANQLGLQATPYKNLGSASLLQAREPLILHVSSFGQLREYDHWILFLGFRGENPLVSDSASEPYEMTLSELMARWDGVGLLIHESTTPLSDFRRAEAKNRLLWLLLFLLLATSLWEFNIVFASKRLALAVAIVVYGFFLSFAFGFSQHGLLKSGQTLDYVFATFKETDFPKVDFETLKNILANSADQDSFLSVDSRYSEDCWIGQIPGSFNIPVDTNSSLLDRKLIGVPKDTTIVVYCLSAACSFDQHVATKIAAKGYSDVRIFSPGWYGWCAALEKESEDREKP